MVDGFGFGVQSRIYPRRELSRSIILAIKGSSTESGCRVWCSGFRSLGFGVSCSGFRVSGFGLRIWCAEFRVEDVGFGVPGLAVRVWCSGFRVEGVGFGVQG